MPNWCDNKLTVNGEPEDVKKFAEATAGIDTNDEQSALAFNKLVPMPEDQKENWYEWNIENWGTKWDANGVNMEGDAEDGLIVYCFQTAWAPPVQWLEKVAAMFPALSFRLKYEEEGAGFLGVAQGKGTIQDQCIDLQ